MNNYKTELYGLLNSSATHVCAVLLLGGIGLYAIDKQSEYFEQKEKVEEVQKDSQLELKINVPEGQQK